MLDQFGENLNVVVVGASGGIGAAFVHHLAADQKVTQIHALSRSKMSFENTKIKTGFIDVTKEDSIEAAAIKAAENGPIDIIIVATGVLHTDDLQPEKALKQLTPEAMSCIFAINTFGPALVAKQFLPFIVRDQRSVFAALSARVGSISDNHLGGWYAYRASKAALNMILKTTAIEIARKYKHAAIIGLHPGTVDTSLSAPFQGHVRDGKLFSAEYSTQQMLQVVNNVSAADSGKVFAYDGEEVPA